MTAAAMCAWGPPGQISHGPGPHRANRYVPEGPRAKTVMSPGAPGPGAARVRGAGGSIVPGGTAAPERSAGSADDGRRSKAGAPVLSVRNASVAYRGGAGEALNHVSIVRTKINVFALSSALATQADPAGRRLTRVAGQSQPHPFDIS
jgi:hypothetical protein